MNIDEVITLIEKLEKSSLSYFKYKAEEEELVLRKGLNTDWSTIPSEIKPITENFIESSTSPGSQTLEDQSNLDKLENIRFVHSPLVGMFYRSAAPDTPPFVEIGSKIKIGDTIAIVESMKIMNEIKAEYEGEVVEILAINGKLVEYEELILKIKVS